MGTGQTRSVPIAAERGPRVSDIAKIDAVMSAWGPWNLPSLAIAGHLLRRPRHVVLSSIPVLRVDSHKVTGMGWPARNEEGDLPSLYLTR